MLSHHRGCNGGQHLVSVSAAVRKETGLRGGDSIGVTLTLNEEPRAAVIPKDLADAFDVNPEAAKFFASLSNSLQCYHVDNINGAKTEETRGRRVEKSVQLFLAAKPR